MAEVSQLLAAFKKADKGGKGTIGRFQLGEVLQELDEHQWSTHDLFELFDAVDPRNTGEVKYKRFVNYILEDAAQDDDDDTDDEDNDAEEVGQAAEEKECDLDLSMRISLKEFKMIARRMGEDPDEAADIYNGTCSDLAEDGVSTDDGVLLEDIIGAFGIEPDNRPSMRHLTEIILEVKDKANRGEEDRDVKVDKMILDPALDSLVRVLDAQKRPVTDAWAAIKEGIVPLSKAQEKIVLSFEDKQDAFLELVKACDVDPPVVNATAGQNANRELCTRKVASIIEKCKADGTKFTDPDFPLTSNPNLCLYVDKEKPGYDCTVGLPSGYKRLTEIIGGSPSRSRGLSLFSLVQTSSAGPVLFKGGARPGDIVQGQIGTCFFLGALGAIAGSNSKSVLQCFIKYDIDIGVYGVRFNVGGEWCFEVVDDYVPVDQYGRILYASSLDKTEMWCALLEKAFCKHHTCYEMCDGGTSSEAIFCMFGGTNGKILISKKHREDPGLYFKALKTARSNGWLLTTTFVKRKGQVNGQGKCGEDVLPGGLVGGHVYSVLKLVEAGGNQLVQIRNPWGTGEWTGRWSDKNQYGEWTDEVKAATGHQAGADDGKFWMDIKDFVDLSGGVDYARTYAAPWKKISQYKHFVKGSIEATAMWAYKAGADDEIGFQKGQVLEVEQIAPGWWYGYLQGATHKGFFPGNYVSLNHRPISRFDAEVTSDDGSDVTAVVMLVQPNVMMKRHWYKRKQDGLNYKETHYPRLQLLVIGPDGSVIFKKIGNKRMLSKQISMKSGAKYKLYPVAADGIGEDFMLRVYLQKGTCKLHEVAGADVAEIKDVLTA